MNCRISILSEKFFLLNNNKNYSEMVIFGEPSCIFPAICLSFLRNN